MPAALAPSHAVRPLMTIPTIYEEFSSCQAAKPWRLTLQPADPPGAPWPSRTAMVSECAPRVVSWRSVPPAPPPPPAPPHQCSGDTAASRPTELPVHVIPPQRQDTSPLDPLLQPAREPVARGIRSTPLGGQLCPMAQVICTLCSSGALDVERLHGLTAESLSHHLGRWHAA
jgi:hypothetical protein